MSTLEGQLKKEREELIMNLYTSCYGHTSAADECLRTERQHWYCAAVKRKKKRGRAWGYEHEFVKLMWDLVQRC